MMSPPPSPSKNLKAARGAAQKTTHEAVQVLPDRVPPHAAQEDCDFAHIYSDQPVMLPPPMQCMYYLQGICTNGNLCQYGHGEVGGNEDVSPLDGYRNSLSEREFQAPAEPNVYIPGSSPMNGMYVSPWPYTDAFHYPHFLEPHPAFHGSPVTSLDSVDSSPASSVSEDDPVQYAAYSYFSNPETHPAPAYLGCAPNGDVVTVVPAPYYAMPLYDLFSPKAFYAPAPHQPRSPGTRVKVASFRTKPCRYFKPGSICPSGDACTFIHADPEKRLESPSPAPSPVKLQHELPIEPVSAKEENTRKGYFPISWRVIGGGVTLGGAKEHTDQSDDDESDLSEDSSLPPCPPCSAADFPLTDDADAEADAKVEDNLPTRRPRASSIPSTPMTAHVDIFRLFYAESPGGL